MKKVTFLIGSLGGGGAERVTIAIADYFCRLQYDVKFIIFSNKNNNYDINEDIEINYLPKYENRFSFFKRIEVLKKILHTQQPDYVISLGLGHQYLFLGNIINKYKFILSERNSPKDYYKHWHERFFNKYCFEKAYKVVFQTEGAKAYYSEVIQNKSEIILNPLTPSLPDPYCGKRDKRIVFVGRLASQKNVFMLLQAFSDFSNVYTDYILELYGKGEQKQELIEYAKELQISQRVKFMGEIKNVYEAMLKATMYVSSSDFEGMSNSMIEAMAMGLPVVCTDCPAGGARMVISNGENGILVPIKDHDAMSKAMCRIADDSAFAEKLSQNARKLREELRTDIICEKWKKLLD